MPRKRIVAFTIVGAFAVTAIAGCHGSGGSKAASSVQSEASTAAGLAAPARADASASVVTARSDVVTATISVTTSKVGAAADKITGLVAANQGRVDGDDRSDGDGPRTATVTVRVPPARLARVIAGVDRLGKETARTLTSVDVTTSKADVDARVLALATSVTRLRHLLATAGSVASLLAVEKVLTSRQSELDSLRARQRVLNDQIALATLTISLRSPARALAPVRHRPFHATGFFAAVGRSIHGLGVAALVVVATIGYALPFAVPLALLGLGFLVLRRCRRGDVGTTAVEPDTA